MTDSRYIGRFAPPLRRTPLRLSDRRARQLPASPREPGIWRVRIEDIDPPREVPGAADTILRQLDHYGLHWDGDVLWQSQRHEAYREALTWLGEQGLSYYCTCTRARIHAVGGIYDGHCRDLGLGRKTPRCACAKPVRCCSLATVCAARSSPMSRWRVRILLSTVATGCSPTTGGGGRRPLSGDHRDCPRRRPD